ncbi:MAG TPA: hypothetical protein VHW44_29095 [Pseudonocardiaceae bacterium]|jgi:hypothetical protein|nr:hypothetical protein [Pseudonocardiaceae bacterium]
MADRGLLLLDVDGPLNPYAAGWPRRPRGYLPFLETADGGWIGGWQTRWRKGYRVWLHPGHGELLHALAAQTGLELVWATAWQHVANARIAPAIGLDPLPVIEFTADMVRDNNGRSHWRRGGRWPGSTTSTTPPTTPPRGWPSNGTGSTCPPCSATSIPTTASARRTSPRSAPGRPG